MRSPILAALLIVSPIFAAVPALADPLAQPAATPPAKLTFEICRLAGVESVDLGEVITVPSGTQFEETRAAEADPTQDKPSAAPPAISVVTTEAASIPADRSCIAVAAKPVGNVDEAALRATVGEMFEPDTNWREASDVDPLGMTYAYWQSGDD